MSVVATPASALRPDREVDELARHMTSASASRVHAAILEETIVSAERGDLREAGRTACGSLEDLHEPHKRFPRAVELQECPVTDAMGIWHTHVTREQLVAPENSLPDIAQVAFGNAEVWIVVGLQSQDVVVAGRNRAAMAAAYRNALGLDVASPRQVVAAIVDGRIGDLEAARDRVRRALGPLIRRERVHVTNDRALRARLSAVPTEQELLEDAGTPVASAPLPRATAQGAIACEQFRLASPDVGHLRQNARQASDAFEMLVRRVASEGFDEAIGIVAGTIISDFLLNQ